MYTIQNKIEMNYQTTTLLIILLWMILNKKGGKGDKDTEISSG